MAIESLLNFQCLFPRFSVVINAGKVSLLLTEITLISIAHSTTFATITALTEGLKVADVMIAIHHPQSLIASHVITEAIVCWVSITHPITAKPLAKPPLGIAFAAKPIAFTASVWSNAPMTTAFT